MTKSELRKEFLSRRNLFSNDEVIEFSRNIAKRFSDTIDLSHVHDLHIYIPIAKFREIDTSSLVETIWREFPKIRTSAPRVDRESGELHSVVFNADSGFVENYLGIREPDGVELIGPETVDMVIVPLLCFDKGGFRVGYGKGFYDRFLAKCRPDCSKIGLSFFPPVENIDDTFEFDIRLNMCVTPEYVFPFEN